MTEPVTNPYAPPDPHKPPPQPPQRHAVERPRPPAQEPPQLTPEQIRGVTGSVMRFGMLMLVSLLAGGLPLPWQLIAPIAGAATMAYGVAVLIRVVKLRWRGLLTPLLIGGLALTGMTTMTTTFQLTLFWDEQVAYQECREQAITIAAKERCLNDYRDATTPSQT